MSAEHLYIHVPFCLRRCSYCDFAVTVSRQPPVEEWLACLDAELRLTAAREGWAGRQRLQTIYVGGGTPSLLGGAVMGRLGACLEAYFHWDARDVEWTTEANPETFDLPLARAWQASGVNRVSLGAQTFQAEPLRWMGRLHGPEGPGRALRAAREAGIANVSLDLIFGLPTRLGRNWEADLGEIIGLSPEHVSLYGLTAERETPLGRWVAEGREVLADEAAYEREYLAAAKLLGAAGFVHYEVSNFAQPGYESRHNAAYWRGVGYLGIGPGAHSYLPPRRFWNTRDWGAYRARLRDGQLARAGQERPDAAQTALERVWLGLRTRTGISRDTLSEGQQRVVRDWCGVGWARATRGQITLTPRGWLLLDRLAVELDAAA